MFKIDQAVLCRRYNSSGTVTLRLEVDRSSVLRVVGADAVVEVEHMEEKPIQSKGENTCCSCALLILSRIRMTLLAFEYEIVS